ncbi:hypothetical protein SAMN05216326_1564 [Nitrosomonas marina]|uniref:5-bromo-4-chloroindolyl phosphate hydrolysis protein n=1 Tax=Nitrosomonas marina TaxID=917 RepID=A0A1I0G6T2_9PROT|nr:hypothetical protein [Nitrosomonas marina]SET66476.1 hypothetical protein SAMN05216326_1564 [Nitrosomonas marina]
MILKRIGICLIIISFLTGAFLTSLDAAKVLWTYFIPALLLGFVGLAITKNETSKAAHSDSRLNNDLALMTLCLENIIKNLNEINQKRETLPIYQAHIEIDRLFREDLNNFAQARESMRHTFGLQNYANILSSFAAGERYINRIWSASSDGYVDEVKTYITKALGQFIEAKSKFDEAKIS